MMRCLFTFIFAFGLSGGLCAQDIQKRELHTFHPDEWLIHKNENRMQLKSDSNGFLFFIGKQTMGDTSYYMVLDGEMFGPYDHIFDPEIGENYAETGNYWFVFHKGEKKYLMFNGITFGPYQRIGPRGGWYHCMMEKPDQYAFTFQNKGKESIVINGREYGPFDIVHNYYTTYERDIKIWSPTAFTFRYKDGGKEYINFSGTVFGPMDELDPIRGHYTAEGPNQTYFIYTKDEQRYIYADGTSYGPFLETTQLGRSKEGKMFFVGKKTDGYHVYYDGQELGPYQNVTDTWVDESLHFHFKRKGQWHGYCAGKEYGPYPELIKIKSVGGRVDVLYKDQKFEYNLMMGDQLYGPYENFIPKSWTTNDEGGFGFVAQSEGEYFAMINGKRIKHQYALTVADIELGKDKSYIMGYTTETPEGLKNYTLVCGKSYGPYAQSNWHNAAITDKKNWSFKYKTEDGYGLQSSGGNFGPYEKCFVQMDKDKKLAFRAVEEQGQSIYINGKMWGPYDHAFFTDIKNTHDFKYRNGERIVKVVDGKELEVTPNMTKPWRHIVSADGKHVLNYSFEENYLLIDGEKRDNPTASCFGFTWNKSKGAFQWMTLEGLTMVECTLQPKAE